MRTRRTIPLFIRFARLVDVRSPKECWPWLGAKGGNGYGNISIGDSVVCGAHRVMYQLHYGVDPGDGLVTHQCDNKICVNPYHLRLGTPESNLQEFMDRGVTTAWWGARTKIGPDTAELIRENYEMGNWSMRDLGENYGVSGSVIWSIVHKRRRVDR